VANPSHVAKLEQGVHAWNDWIVQSGERPDLSRLVKPNVELAGIHFGGANLREVDFSGADLSLAHLGGADFTSARLNGTVFRQISAENCSFRSCSAAFADFSDATLSGTSFSKANLIRSSFSGARVDDVNFSHAILSGADFTGANLYHSNFSDSDLREASFTVADLRSAVLSGAKLWALRTSEWKTKNLKCHSAYIDREARNIRFFEPGEFAREYTSPRLYRIEISKDSDYRIMGSFHHLLEYMAKEASDYSIRVDPSDDDGSDMVIQVNATSKEKQNWEETVAKIANLKKQLEVTTDERDRAQDRLNALAVHVIDGVLDSSTMNSRILGLRLIVFLDICGFSQLEEEPAEQAVVAFWRLGKAILVEKETSFLNTWGDAIVCAFESVDYGILQTWHLIKSLKVQGILVRAGAHYGRVWARHNALTNSPDFGGDDVNLAARIQPHAEPGELVISTETWEELDSEKSNFKRTGRTISLKKGTRSHPTNEPLLIFSITKDA
jgi:uncharacterized protein YjbI with pentapeptide repeats/class 3 adenylate cyclase